tara:strand:+ start:980 stop:1483 length:504 start_codon:yes stop_codon:yes gene_type:complete
MEMYRFNFSDEFKQRLREFATKHSEDDLYTFKDNFETWQTNNKYNIENEEIRLKRFGFIGNMEMKMFKSIRYYFMKRCNERATKPKERQKYICKDNNFLTCIKTHIEGVNKQNLKPSVAYNDFSEKHKDEIIRMKNMLVNIHDYEESNAMKKIKKIYKNKYFTESRK